MKSAYMTPVLHRLGGIAEITGTGEFPCIDLNGDGQGKTLGAPSDLIFRFGPIVIPLPTTECVTGS